MMLTKASMADFQEILALYKQVCADMVAGGLKQWNWGQYPNEEIVRTDVENGDLYIIREDGKLLCAVVLNQKFDKEYKDVNWLFGVNPGAFHRFVISPDTQGKGLGRRVMAEILDILREMGCDSLRCDTYIDNVKALHLYESLGMRRSGEIYFAGEGEGKPYPSLEMPLTVDCPLLPLRMHPAFRGGGLTPWGGEKLHSVYGKKVKDAVTGESLEVSCIPGLESTDDMGVKLPELIAKYGKAFAGLYADKPFPLLLKIIDAKDNLSVQVHPDDAYAAANENGKLGKTEAWLILDAPEGSQLVYGIQPGTTIEELRAACEQGAAVEPLLRRVTVKPGDVCSIPAGCVHTIGAGIMLYEIQQSSDVTYRFYDWDRVDAQGHRRELHLDKALAVTDLNFALNPIPANDAPASRVLDEKYFTLDLFRVDGETYLPETENFGLLTSLEGDVTLVWQGGQMQMKKGESVYIPASAPAMMLTGKGRAALSMAQ